MADTRTDNGSPERVAYDMACMLAREEMPSPNRLDRAKFLELFTECRRAAMGLSRAAT
jgi:hypothetical protein